MDFVARAGAIIDRAHRMAGVLIVCVIVLGAALVVVVINNSSLNNQLSASRLRLPVIVVPDASEGVYSPTEEDRLIALFADFVTQSFNSYTPENIAKLYAGLRPFMGPALLTDSEKYFQQKIRDATSDRRSQFFVPDRTQPPQVTKYTVNGMAFRDVVLVGQLQTVVGGTIAESNPIQYEMTFQKVFASPANPYGFLLTKYHEKLLIDPNKAPQLNAPAGQ